ncbi:hypothetical protein FUAX_55090 (plasmid) [Fulvitalea axinellae]|uniref:Uncharacterized protein n=2 Tax=Fulvitalea axinellae TaxID=1182444 RepID=A0AAU9CZ97_9BACT|nr:hypothetical protein FUAX_55090 [Fulvitalea axinellae]
MEKGLPLDMKGNYCQFEDRGEVRFIEIYTLEYDIKEVEFLNKIGVYEESNTYSFIRLCKGDIPKGTRYIYKLMTYLNDSKSEDLWTFNEAIHEYEEVGFTTSDELFLYCEDRWGIGKQDFTGYNETDLPY